MKILKLFTSVILYCLLTWPSMSCADEQPLRIMPLGDSITAGYTDNPNWLHPFEFGYRAGLYHRLAFAGYDFVFVGESEEPFNLVSGDPTHGGAVTPTFDLRGVSQNGHRGYGGWLTNQIQQNVAQWILNDQPDVILLMIGINGISATSPQQLNSLVETIYNTDNNVTLIVAQITPLSQFNQNLFNYNTYIRETLVPNYVAMGYSISTVDMYKHFLIDQDDPTSIDATRLSNGINHPTNTLYDKMAETWFHAIEILMNNQ